MTSPIIGARNLEQLDANLGAAGWQLSQDQCEQLTLASNQRVPHLYGTIADPKRLR